MPSINLDIVEKVRENSYFRQELLTNEFSQVVEMTIEPGNDVGERVYEGDAVLCVVDGCGETVLNRRHSPIKPGSLVAIPAGTRHNTINTGSSPLKLIILYAPPQDAPGTIYRTKAEAQAAADAADAADAANARKNGIGNADA